MPEATLHVGVLLADPRMPYPYAPDGRLDQEELDLIGRVRPALERIEGYRFTYFDDHERLIDDLRDTALDLALNLCDTGYRNDWDLERDIPALLEILGIPYTGADPMAISLSTDKSLVRCLAVNHGVAVPSETFVDLRADPLVLPSIYPCLIKPNSSGGSFGITEDCVVDDPAAAERYLLWLREQLLIPEALIQDFLAGPEYAVGLIGNPDDGYTVLPPAQMDYSRLPPDVPPIQTYSWKSDPHSPYLNTLDVIEADLDEITRGQLIEYAATMFRRLGMRDYARFDFRCGADGHPRLLDANTNPSWYSDSKMALMAQWAGYDYSAMLRLILEAARHRYGI